MSPRTARGDDARRGVAPGTVLSAVVVILLLIACPLVVRGAVRSQYPWAADTVAVMLLAVVAAAVLPGAWRLRGCLGILALAAGMIAAGGGAALPYLPPVAVNLALAGLFGVTLRAGSESMISRFARLERGTLEPDLERYCRALTWIWTLFFVVMAALSAVLAALPDSTAWQWFSALGNWLCVAALFAGEWVYRRLRFAHYRHGSPLRLLALIRAKWRA